jgi:serine-type D-Ala-D-Ala carboxypeptidase/endopeptidase
MAVDQSMKQIAVFIALHVVSAAVSLAVTREEVDGIVAAAAKARVSRGIVVGTIDADGRAVFGYGRMSEGDARTPDGKTIFEIGSVSKVFTAALLAQMVLTKEARLDEPVQDLLPAGVIVPRKEGVAIALLHLTAQTSGLPRLPANMQPADPQDPYGDYSAERLYEGLRQIELAHRPGEKYLYSNLGVGLLGQALAERARKSYEELLVERVCRPMGLNDTRITLDERLRERLTTGHYPFGLVALNWNFDALAGAGALRSTADDLLTFLAANLKLIETPLKDALKMTHEVRAAAWDESDIAMGWHVTKKHGVRWHNGQTGGYHSFIAFVPGERVGIVVLGNVGGAVVDEIGFELCRVVTGEKLMREGAGEKVR